MEEEYLTEEDVRGMTKRNFDVMMRERDKTYARAMELKELRIRGKISKEEYERHLENGTMPYINEEFESIFNYISMKITEIEVKVMGFKEKRPCLLTEEFARKTQFHLKNLDSLNEKIKKESRRNL